MNTIFISANTSGKNKHRKGVLPQRSVHGAEINFCYKKDTIDSFKTKKKHYCPNNTNKMWTVYIEKTYLFHILLY